MTMGGLPERRMPKLSKFLVPVLSYEEMEVLVLEMLGKYLEKMPHRSISMMVRQDLLMRWGLILQMSLYIATTIRLQCSL